MANLKDEHGFSVGFERKDKRWHSSLWLFLRPVLALTANVLSHLWPWIRQPILLVYSILMIPLSWASGLLLLVAGSIVLTFGFFVAAITSWIAILIFIVKLGPLSRAVWASIPRPLSHFFFNDLPIACIKIFMTEISGSHSQDQTTPAEKTYGLDDPEANHGVTLEQNVELETNSPYLGSEVLFDPDDGVLKTDFESSGGWKIAGDMEEYKLRSRNNSELHLSRSQDRQHRRTRTGGSIRFSGASSPESVRTPPPLYMKSTRDSRDSTHQKKKRRSASTTSSPESYFRMTASTPADQADPEDNPLRQSPSGSSSTSIGSTGRLSSHDIA